ncbi:MAG: hypothetical protein A3K19_20470 [Lentisphaerae bacterium RIFOXYB12_FULL_65_16]|nr:MAG: hypothetical protein A3K18_32650 [Lentisphaerae bacterium RIFOXYA12_64_32]OGV89336.1 MAG: hypothetical protein A3K19_20470 [Lentisphaerae bacterium RIFOXYB12_FULL_65_16]
MSSFSRMIRTALAAVLAATALLPAATARAMYCNNDPVNLVDPLGLAAYYFDGTANHPHPRNLDGTPNYKTNVRKLYDVTRGAAFYAYGIGSGYNADGSLTTSGVANEGATGNSMKERAEWMLGKLESQLRAGDKVVDLFGFSRGSATATYFLNRIQQEVDRGNPLYRGIEIRFVALFDQVPSKLGMTRTVGSAAWNATLASVSFGAWGYNPYERISDSSGEFHFTLPKGMRFTHRPLHPVALDEGRREFAVTDLQGALQVGFRGVHSNVGGGYPRDFFEYITCRFVYERATRAGLGFFDEKYRAMDPSMRGLYDRYAHDFDAGFLPLLDISPTDNSKAYWDDGEPRALPQGMVLHPSVRWFKSAPANPIPAYIYLP